MLRSDAFAARAESSVESNAKRKKTLIFISGIAARSGTTYLIRLLVTHPDICRPEGHWELPLLGVVDRFEEFHAAFLRTRKPGRLDYSFDDFAKAFGAGFMDLLVDRVSPLDRAAEYLLHKNPGTEGIQHFRKFFPDGKLIFLVRDGRDNVNSLLAAEGFRNSSLWNPNRLRNLFIYTRMWARSARRILADVSTSGDEALLVKYEELHLNPRQVLERIADYVGLPVSEKWLCDLGEVPVKGSNFYGIEKGTRETEIGSKNQTNWKETPKTAEFNPVGRWRSSWSFLDKLLFRKIAGREMKELGYLDC